MKLEDIKDKELIEEARSLYNTVHVSDCYNGRDVIRCELVQHELISRGYEIKEIKYLRITQEVKCVENTKKKGEDDEEDFIMVGGD